MNQNSQRYYGFWVVATVGALYGIAWGPVGARMETTSPPPAWLVYTYAPVSWLSDHTPAGSVLTGYVRLWERMLGPPN